MSGLDHETNHDGECFHDCKECRLLELEHIVDIARAITTGPMPSLYSPAYSILYEAIRKYDKKRSSNG